LARERKLIPAPPPNQPDLLNRSALEALLRGAGGGEPDDQQVEAYYAAHHQEFQRPERAQLRQILVEDRQQAEQIRARVRQVADFQEVARETSRDPGGGLGGYQGE